MNETQTKRKSWVGWSEQLSQSYLLNEILSEETTRRTAQLCPEKKNLQTESLGQMSNLPDVIFIPSHDGITPPEPYTAHRLM